MGYDLEKLAKLNAIDQLGTALVGEIDKTAEGLKAAGDETAQKVQDSELAIKELDQKLSDTETVLSEKLDQLQVPEKVSELENDCGYQTAEQVSGSIETALENQSGAAGGSLNDLEGVLDIAHGGTGNSTGYVTAGLAPRVNIGEKATAEGNYTYAIGQYSHCEGSDTVARAFATHAEGMASRAESAYSHAEGYSCITSGNYSHAEGNNSRTGAFYAHAEGNYTEATAPSAHSEGLNTKAGNYASHAGGKYNSDMAQDASEESNAGDAFAIGNGTSSTGNSNCFRINYSGEVYALSEFNSTGADYAEYFEWEDGNAEHEDRVGYFVTVQNGKIKKAEKGDYILGIVSGNPCIIGNADENWLGRWEHDDFERFVKEPVDTPMLDDDGNETGEISHGWRYKLNPAYDKTRPYVQRKDRQEWDAVGMLGVLAVRDNGSCEVNGFCTVNDDGMATKAETNGENCWRVISRVSGSVVKVVFR